jgi:secreted trypsin-like serine protease
MRRLFAAALAAGTVASGCTGRGSSSAEDSATVHYCRDAALVPGRAGLTSEVEAAVAVMGFGPAGESFLCSGAVVGPTKVLTARHCLEDRDDWEILVFFGADAAGGLDEESVGVSEHTLHPSRDLALLTLEEPTDVTPLAWADPADAVDPSAQLLGVGYGAPVGEPTRCLRAEAAGTSAGYVRGATSIEVRLGDDLLCEGDSGGPLLVERGDELVVVGVLATSLRPDGEECSAEVTFTALSKDDAWTAAELGSPGG